MNDGDISANTTSKVESMSDDEKMFLYARAVHSNHLMHVRIQKHDDGRNGFDSLRIKSTKI